MDIAEFAGAYAKASDDGREVEIINPNDGAKIGLAVTIAGPYSERAAQADRDHADWSIQNPNATADERRQAIRRRTAKYVVSWRFAEGKTWRGAIPDCTLDNVIDVLSGAAFIHDQVLAEAQRTQGFIKG